MSRISEFCLQGTSFMRRILSRWLLAATVAVSAPVLAQPTAPHATPASAYIVQSHGTQAAVRIVRGVGGRITHDLPIIHGVSAMLTPAQAARLRQLGTVDLFTDSAVKTQWGSTWSGTAASSTMTQSARSWSGAAASSTMTQRASTSSGGEATVPNQDARVEIGADRLGAQGFDGSGVTVAILDTGVAGSWIQAIQNTAYSKRLVTYSADASRFEDYSGHGSHVATIIGNTIRSLNGQPLGLAPMVTVVAVKAFDGNGSSTYATVLSGLNWIFNNRATYNIRVLNLSFAAKPQSFYWNDPIDQAVMSLWQAGVVVVASAGNWGPKAQTIGVPGTVPYIITVGAMTDNYTPANPLNYRLTSFSSTGPTFEGFVKPEILAPGGNIIGTMDAKTALIAQQHPEFQLHTEKLYIMTGTSKTGSGGRGVIRLGLRMEHLVA